MGDQLWQRGQLAAPQTVPLDGPVGPSIAAVHGPGRPLMWETIRSMTGPLCPRMGLPIQPKITKLERVYKNSFITSSLTLVLGLPLYQVCTRVDFIPPDSYHSDKLCVFKYLRETLSVSQLAKITAIIAHKK